MSSMEVDMPGSGLPKPSSPASNGHHVQFDTEVKVVTVSAPQQQPRPKHKSRRRARVPNLELGEDETSPVSSTAKPPTPSKLKKMAEKDRQSRTGRSGKPKKGGAGGKGTWGNLTDQMFAVSGTHDSHDPNYDSDNEETTYLVSPSSPQMSPLDFEKNAKDIIQEYFDHGDTQEVASSFEELNIKNIKHEILRVVVTLALEEKAVNREKASVLLSDLYGQSINGREMAKGFELVLSELDDLVLDTPDAALVVGNFMARCVADDCLPPSFLSSYPKSEITSVVAALKRAQLLLGMKHSIARLDNVWGVGGGQRPVMFLISKMNLLLKEYLSSSDIEEAIRCLQELEVPHFHHELVYEAIVLVMELATDTCAQMMCTLLQHMATTGIISRDQFNTGFLRVFSDITDIVLDIPNAYHNLNKFVERGLAAGFVSPRLEVECPTRGRKRYVSEGDGGAIKEPED